MNVSAWWNSLDSLLRVFAILFSCILSIQIAHSLIKNEDMMGNAPVRKRKAISRNGQRSGFSISQLEPVLPDKEG